MINDMLINVREASRRTGRTVRTIRWWIASGRLPAVKVTKEWLINENDLRGKDENDYADREHPQRAETA